MTILRIVFVILVLVILLSSNGVFPPLEELQLESGSFLIGVFLLAGIGLLVFRQGIWSEDAGKLFKPQVVILKTDKTPFQVLTNSFKSQMMLVIALAVATTIALEYTGHHEELVQLLEFFQSKSERLINALTN